jgi:type III secretion protein L
VRQALQSVRGEQRVRVRVALKDEAFLREGLSGLLRQKNGGPEGFLDIIADPELLPGDCILESDLGTVEASLETQLQNLEKALLSKVKNV